MTEGEGLCIRTGKHRYPTEGEARAALRGAKTKGRPPSKQIQSIYVCRFCKGYHLSHRHRKDYARIVTP